MNQNIFIHRTTSETEGLQLERDFVSHAVFTVFTFKNILLKVAEQVPNSFQTPKSFLLHLCRLAGLGGDHQKRLILLKTKLLK